MNDAGWKTIVAVVAVSILLLCASLVIVAVKLNTQLIGGGVLLTFQIAISVVTSAVTLTITAGLINWAVSKVSDTIAELTQKHKDGLAALQQRTPTFVVCAALVAQVVVTAASEAFDDSAAVIGISVLLLALFWLANELMLKESRAARVTGWVFWVFSVLLLPTAVVLHRNTGISGLFDELRKIPSNSLIVLGLSILLTLLAPFAVNYWSRKSDVNN